MKVLEITAGKKKRLTDNFKKKLAKVRLRHRRKGRKKQKKKEREGGDIQTDRESET